jgi:hypothetical protein
MRQPTHVDATALLAQVMGKPATPVGRWLSEDGTVRLDINTDGTYDGQVAGRKRRAHGTYFIDGAEMTLSDDSGLHTPVVLQEGRLEMAGHRLGPVS